MSALKQQFGLRPIQLTQLDELKVMIKNIYLLAWIIFSFSIYAQDSIKINQNMEGRITPYCWELLEKNRPKMHVDTLGATGTKLLVASQLIEQGCDFSGELSASVKYYFGNPDHVIVWNADMRTNDKAISYYYYVRNTDWPRKGAHGDIWLIISCTVNDRVSKMKLSKFDE